jgi:NAD(P)-dependent dehydrogenase (short-subunit alcohol dehydrogenase family)
MERPRPTVAHAGAEARTEPQPAPTLEGTPMAKLAACDLDGRRVLITGASSGIGRAMAAVFAGAGASLILADIDAEGLARVRDEAATAGCADAACRTLDLGRKDEVDAFWASLQQGCAPDTVVNNAGIYPVRDFLDVDEACLDLVIQVNLASVLWMCQGFIRLRGPAGGVIINVSSIEAVNAFKEGMTPYITSKAGVLGLSRALAKEYGRKGFRINTLVPGGIRTPGTMSVAKRVVTEGEVSLIKTGYDFMQRLPLGRFGRPEEVANVALFLASDLASYVHGAAIPVDGGFLSA